MFIRKTYIHNFMHTIRCIFGFYLKSTDFFHHLRHVAAFIISRIKSWKSLFQDIAKRRKVYSLAVKWLNIQSYVWRNLRKSGNTYLNFLNFLILVKNLILVKSSFCLFLIRLFLTWIYRSICIRFIRFYIVFLLLELYI